MPRDDLEPLESDVLLGEEGTEGIPTGWRWPTRPDPASYLIGNESPSTLQVFLAATGGDSLLLAGSTLVLTGGTRGRTRRVISGPDFGLVARARQRIDRIASQTRLWNSSEEPQADISPNAVHTAMSIFERLTWNPPAERVAIFPTETGGLRLQVIGEERALTLDIADDGQEMQGSYAGDDVYHAETFRTVGAAADFIAQSVR